MDLNKATQEAIDSAKNRLRAIVNRLTKAGKKYEDPDFPANSTSISPRDDSPGFEMPTGWERISVIKPDACLFKGGNKPAGDIRQGTIGTACFLDALHANRDLVPSLIIFHDVNVGIYACRLFHEGQWRVMIVDDFVPVTSISARSACISFAVSSEESEVWPCILEKCYAKLHRCYANVDGCVSRHAMSAVTGVPPTRYLLDKQSVPPIGLLCVWYGYMRTGAGKTIDLCLCLSLAEGRVGGGGDDAKRGPYRITGTYDWRRASFSREFLRGGKSEFSGDLKVVGTTWSLVGTLVDCTKTLDFELTPSLACAADVMVPPVTFLKKSIEEGVVSRLAVKGRSGVHDDAANQFTGLFEGRSYGALSVHTVEEKTNTATELVCMDAFNHSVLWKGAWSQDSLKMTKARRELLGYQPSDTSRFFMDLEDVQEFGESFDFFRPVPESWHVFQWEDTLNVEERQWYSGPQYHIAAYGPVRLRLFVHQPACKPRTGTDVYPAQIGLRVVVLCGNELSESSAFEVARVTPVSDHTVATEVEVAYPVVGQALVVVPTTSALNAALPYRLTVAASAAVDVVVPSEAMEACMCCGVEANPGWWCCACPAGERALCDRCHFLHGWTDVPGHGSLTPEGVSGSDDRCHRLRRQWPEGTSCVCGRKCVAAQARADGHTFTSEATTPKEEELVPAPIGADGVVCLGCEPSVMLCGACAAVAAGEDAEGAAAVEAAVRAGGGGDHCTAHIRDGAVVPVAGTATCRACNARAFVGSGEQCTVCAAAVCAPCKAANGWKKVPEHEEHHAVKPIASAVEKESILNGVTCSKKVKKLAGTKSLSSVGGATARSSGSVSNQGGGSVSASPATAASWGEKWFTVRRPVLLSHAPPDDREALPIACGRAIRPRAEADFVAPKKRLSSRHSPKEINEAEVVDKAAQQGGGCGRSGVCSLL